MGDAGFFRGTSAEQDNRFTDKQKKLMKTLKFEENLTQKLDMKKVNLDIIKPWITARVNDYLGLEDDVLVEFIFSQLEDKKVDPRSMQINLTGFLNAKKAREFMGELWAVLLSAQDSPDGIPPAMLEAKKEELKKKMAEEEELKVAAAKEEARIAALPEDKRTSGSNKDNDRRRGDSPNRRSPYRRRFSPAYGRRRGGSPGRFQRNDYGRDRRRDDERDRERRRDFEFDRNRARDDERDRERRRDVDEERGRDVVRPDRRRSTSKNKEEPSVTLPKNDSNRANIRKRSLSSSSSSTSSAERNKTRSDNKRSEIVSQKKSLDDFGRDRRRDDERVREQDNERDRDRRRDSDRHDKELSANKSKGEPSVMLQKTDSNRSNIRKRSSSGSSNSSAEKNKKSADNKRHLDERVSQKKSSVDHGRERRRDDERDRVQSNERDRERRRDVGRPVRELSANRNKETLPLLLPKSDTRPNIRKRSSSGSSSRSSSAERDKKVSDNKRHSAVQEKVSHNKPSVDNPRDRRRDDVRDRGQRRDFEFDRSRAQDEERRKDVGRPDRERSANKSKEEPSIPLPKLNSDRVNDRKRSASGSSDSDSSVERTKKVSDNKRRLVDQEKISTKKASLTAREESKEKRTSPDKSEKKKKKKDKDKKRKHKKQKKEKKEKKNKRSKQDDDDDDDVNGHDKRNKKFDHLDDLENVLRKKALLSMKKNS